jgi:hypothetical protein
MMLRLGLADRLRITMAALDKMTVAEFNMLMAFHAERSRPKDS